MLENLVSSRIRRALLEHVLQHPQGRFYLRGLAKELGLSITPLRRELKRLEKAGALQAVPEGNMLFYTVNTTSAMFTQLQHAGGQGVERPVPIPPVAVVTPSPIDVGLATVNVSAAPQQGPRQRLGLKMVSASMTLGLVVIGAVFMMKHQAQPDGAMHGAAARLPAQHAPGAGAMQGTRWRITPGGVGGFSASAGSEAISR